MTIPGRFLLKTHSNPWLSFLLLLCACSVDGGDTSLVALDEEPPPPEAIQKDNAETLLKKMIEQNNPEHTEACFILAVMLERKRVIKNKDQVRQENGKRMLIYEHAKNGDVLTILDPALKLDELGDVQAKVSELLEHGLNPSDGE